MSQPVSLAFKWFRLATLALTVGLCSTLALTSPVDGKARPKRVNKLKAGISKSAPPTKRACTMDDLVGYWTAVNIVDLRPTPTPPPPPPPPPEEKAAKPAQMANLMTVPPGGAKPGNATTSPPGKPGTPAGLGGLLGAKPGTIPEAPIGTTTKPAGKMMIALPASPGNNPIAAAASGAVPGALPSATAPAATVPGGSAPPTAPASASPNVSPMPTEPPPPPVFYAYGFNYNGFAKYRQLDQPTIGKADYNGFQLTAFDNLYNVDSKGKLTFKIPGDPKPVNFMCQVVIKDVKDKTGEVVLDEGDIVLRLLGPKGKVLEEQQLKRVR